MSGALSSLGLGSGVLTYDVIDQLRAADETAKIEPITKLQEDGQEKLTAIDELIDIMQEYKDAIEPLSDESTYLQRSVSVTGDEATIEVEAGVNPQTINLHIDQLAKQDILQSKSYASSDTVAVYQNTTLNVFINETSYNVKLTAGMTLADIASELSAQTSNTTTDEDGNTTTESLLIGSALKVGGSDPYKLILKSANAGDENRILLGTTKMGKSYNSNIDFTSLDTDDMVINGVDIFDGVDTSEYDSLSDVVDAINGKSDDTHVKAFLSQDKTKIIFNNADGLQIDFTGSDFGTSGNMTKLGLTQDNINGISASTTSDSITTTDYQQSYATSDSTKALEINGVEVLEGNNISSLQDVIDAINSNFKQTGVSAQIVSDKIKLNNSLGGAIYLDGDALSNLGLDGKELTGTSVTGNSSVGYLGSNYRFDENDFKINNTNIFDDNTKPNDVNELVDLINAKSSDSGVSATVSSGKLVLTSNDGGSISFYGSNDDTLKHLGLYGTDKSSPIAQNTLLTSLQLTHDNLYDDDNSARVQTPQDAEFYFNGVKINRSTNEVDDLVVGVTITLLKPNEDDDIVKAEITQDTDKIYDALKDGMEKYSTMVSKIKELTNYDATTKETGALQGVSEVTRLYTSISNKLLSTDSTLDFQSLVSLGLEVDSDGNITVDYDAFKKKLEKNADAVEKLFRGYDTTYRGEDTFIDGIFTDINDFLDTTVEDDESTLKLYKTTLQEQDTKYDEEITKATEDLDTKYAIMAEKFSSYDSMIAKMQNSFAPLQQIISAESS